MSQSEFLPITGNLLKVREKSHLQDVIDFGYASHSQNWREIFKPISERSYRNRVITFDNHLKTTLTHNLR